MDNTKGHQIVQNFSTPAWFREWPNPTVPAVAAGVYVVWREGQLIYAGMSGRNIEKQQHRKKYGLVTRLESHAKGRLSGDQFNVYVANRFVVPGLTAKQQSQMSTGVLHIGYPDETIHPSVFSLPVPDCRSEQRGFCY